MAFLVDERIPLDDRFERGVDSLFRSSARAYAALTAADRAHMQLCKPV
jgi:hypothetical protein